jgi:uncharacterized protein (DUF2249 family)
LPSLPAWPYFNAMPATKFKSLDVRQMLEQGIEPFPKIRAKVDALMPGTGLVVVASFMPAPLIEKLRSEGFSSSVERRRDGAWATHFWRE